MSDVSRELVAAEELLARLLAARGVELDRSRREAFRAYYALLVRANERINLTAITEPLAVYVKHFWDSLTPLFSPYFPREDFLVDVGTGAGFPSLPMKILRPSLQILGLEATRKRVLFVREVVRRLGLEGVTVLHARVEEYARSHPELYRFAVARAVAPLERLLPWVRPLLLPGGLFLAMKGPGFQEEVAAARAELEAFWELVGEEAFPLPEGFGERVLLWFRRRATEAG
ncbi:MAG: 16S rRNA (guanine(527)-N(7))-methyltransferase RsmG [Brockia lithotrophica]|nr:16S rRNA (guanine(527)-N(7))-methyltransferase RsmG [Brockia lithotrophica]